MNEPQSPHDDPPPGLDEKALESLRSLDPDGGHGILARVLSTYENSLRRMLGQFEQARRDGDVAAVGSLAHTLKSSSASVGATALAALCADAERAVRTGQTDDVLDRVDGLLAEGQRALAAVRSVLQG